MIRAGWPVLLLTVSAALAGPFGGGGAGPFGSGSPPRRPVSLEIASANATIGAATNMPATPAELFSTTINRKPFDSTLFTQYRLVGRQGAIAASGADVCPVYSTDDGATFVYVDGTPTSSACDTSAAAVALFSTPNNKLKSAWLPLPVAARGDYLWTAYTDDGDGAADPTIGLSIQFK